MTVRAALLLALTASGVAGSACAQASRGRPGAGTLKFELVRAGDVSKQVLDSFLVIKPHAGGAQVSMVFDNPCQVQPKGSYQVTGDTLTIRLDHHPHLARDIACPGIYKLEEFKSEIAPLQPRDYTVRVVFDKGVTMLPTRELLREVDVK